MHWYLVIESQMEKPIFLSNHKSTGKFFSFICGVKSIKSITYVDRIVEILIVDPQIPAGVSVHHGVIVIKLSLLKTKANFFNKQVSQEMQIDKKRLLTLKKVLPECKIYHLKKCVHKLRLCGIDQRS